MERNTYVGRANAMELTALGHPILEPYGTLWSPLQGNLLILHWGSGGGAEPGAKPGAAGWAWAEFLFFLVEFGWGREV